MFAAFVIKTRLRTVSLLGFYPETIVFPIPKMEAECIIPISEPLQWVLSNNWEEINLLENIELS